MKYLLNTIILFFSFNLSSPIAVYAQDGPPAMAMPNKQNTKLINELIEVTDFKNFFNSYCVSRISSASKENNWTTEKTKEITESINFKNFNWCVQNALTLYKEKELQKLIELYKTDPEKYKLQNVITKNDIIQSNLKSFGDNLINGN